MGGEQDNPEVTEGSGNIYADLEFENADEMLIKAGLVLALNQTIDETKLTGVEAATMLDLTQAELSALRRGRFDAYTYDRLMHFLTRLGHDVNIVVIPKPAQENRDAQIFVNFTHASESITEFSAPKT